MTCHISPLKLTGCLSTGDRLPHRVGIALFHLTQLPLLVGATLILTRSPSTAFYLVSLIVSSPPVSALSLTKEPDGSFQRANLILLPHTAKSSPGSHQCQYRSHPSWHRFSSMLPFFSPFSGLSSSWLMPMAMIHYGILTPIAQKHRGPASMT